MVKIVEKGELIDQKILQLLSKYHPNRNGMKIFSIFDCLEEEGICVNCYGWDLVTRRPVLIGTRVGVIAAQSIGDAQPDA